MFRNRIKVYWLLLLVLMYTASFLMSIGESQARYQNTVVGNTLMESKTTGITSNCLVTEKDAPLTVLVGEMSLYESETVSFWLRSSGADATGKLAWEVSDPDYAQYLNINMQSGLDFIDPDEEIKLLQDVYMDISMILTPTEFARSTVHGILKINVLVTWGDEMWGTFQVILPEVKEKTDEETQPKETEPETTKPTETQPEETKPAETQPKETEPEVTQPKETLPAETQAAETEPQETVKQETEPEETKETTVQETLAEQAQAENLPENNPSPTNETTEPTETDPTDSTTEPDETDPTDSTTEPTGTDPTDTTTEPTGTDPTDSTTEPTGTDPTDSTTEPTGTDPTDSTTEPDITDPTESTVETTEDVEEEAPKNPIRLETITRFDPAEQLPIKAVLTEDVTSIRLGLWVENTKAAEDPEQPAMVLKPFPDYTKFSLNQGDSYYMMYDGYIAEFSLQDMTALTLLLDFSHSELDASEPLVLAMEAYADGELLTVGTVKTTPDAPEAFQTVVHSLQQQTRTADAAESDGQTQPETETGIGWETHILNRDNVLELTLPMEWLEADLEYSVEILKMSETKTLEYAPVALSSAGLSAKYTDYDLTHNLVLQIGETLPQAGTYRVNMEWSYEGICYAHTQTTFFINYSAHTTYTLGSQEVPIDD